MPKKENRTDEGKAKKSRRGRNEGSIRYIEKKKLYEARYSIGIDEKGNTIYKSIYGKKKSELLSKMRNALAALGKGEYVDPSDVSLLSWCKEWYETYKKPTVKINTREKYLTSIKRIENSEIANLQLKYVSHELIQKYYNALKDTFSSETIKATHSVINGALAKAEMINMIVKNPAKNILIPRDEDECDEVKALTEDEYSRFMTEISKRSHYYMFALFLSNTGLRPSEGIALNRNDIDHKNKTVKVDKTYVRALKGIQKSTKTVSSKRTVPVPDNTLKLLKEYILKQKNQKDSDPLFQTLNGTRLSLRNVLRIFKNIGKDIDIEWVNVHTMRHTYASRLFKRKVDIKVISKLLGHKDVSTTYDIYVHFIDSVIEDSVQMLNEGTPSSLPEKQLRKQNNVTILSEAK